MPPSVAPHENFDATVGGEARPIIIVAGMHRSGTSLCAHMLSMMGVDIADDAGAGPGNEEGHWERWEIVDLHNRILASLDRRNGDIAEYMPLHDLALPTKWWELPAVHDARSEIEVYLEKRMRAGEVFGFKDPRVSRLLPMWNQILERRRLSARLVLCLRNPNDVADSLWKRDRIPHAAGLYRWLLYNCEFLVQAGAECHFVNYEDWFDAPLDTAKRLSAFVGCAIPDDPTRLGEMLGIISGKQRHNVSSLPPADSLMGRVYRLLMSKPSGVGEVLALQTIGKEFVAFSQTVPFEQAILGLLNDIQARTSDIADLQGQALAISQSQAEREQSIVELQQAAAAREETIGNLRRSMIDQKEAISAFQQLVADRDRSISVLQESLARREASINDLETSLVEHKTSMGELQRPLTIQAGSSPMWPASWLVMSKEYRLLRKSGLFDEEWYSRQYPESSSRSMRRLVFFLSKGWLAGHNPNPMFDTNWYLEKYPDVRGTRTNPVIHYLCRGASEERDPSPNFNTASYFQDHPELRGGKINPLTHYLRAQRRPSP